MLHKRFQQAKNVMKTLINNGYECFFVGGSVRDYLLNKEIKDVDIATNAKPHIIEQLFQHTVPVGIEHGTVLVVDQGQSYEVTTYRIEDDYEDFRHPSQVHFVDDITLDLSRRDFTINAIAMDLDGNMIDPFHGQKDIQNKLIKTVGDPVERFTEDPLRMLRGIRFTSQLGFTMSEEVIEAIKKNHQLLKKISIERITEEIVKTFNGQYVNKAIHFFSLTDVDESLPIFNHNQSLIINLLERSFEPIQHPSVLFALLHLLKREIALKTWVTSYKLSNEIKNGALHLAFLYNEFETNGWTNYLLYKTEKRWLDAFLQLVKLIEQKEIDGTKIKKQYHNLPIKRRSDLAITGNDIIEWFPNQRRGDWIGDIIAKVERNVVENRLENHYEHIESMVKKWMTTEKN